MASDSPKVLISYSHDSPEHEQRVLTLADRLRAEGIDCTIDQYVLVPEEGWALWMERQIRDSNFVVMVCTETYYQRVMGEERPGKGLGVRWEGDLIYQSIYSAGTIDTKFIPVLFEDGSPSHIPTPLQSTNHYSVDAEDGYEDLYRRLTNQPRAIKPELDKLRSLPPGERRSEGALGRLVNVPNLPPHFLSRPGEFQALKDAVLTGLSNPVALTGAGKIGVQGMGGIGKTVLAAALARDPEVRHAFPDGVIWITLGQTPNVIARQSQVAETFDERSQTFTDVQQGKSRLSIMLQERSCLLILDDVWQLEHAAAFDVLGERGRMLITTRDGRIVTDLGAVERRVDELTDAQALTLLAQWSGYLEEKLPELAKDIVKESGKLPLALAMIGALIRSSPKRTAWPDALARLKRADLDKIKQNFPDYPYQDLLRAIEVSIEGLESADRERYLDLAVFPEDQAIPEEALRVFWNLDDVDTRDCMARFVARSLATWSSANGDGALIIHQLLHDLIRKRRQNELPSLNNRIVDGWGDLEKLPNVYAWRWISYHLMQAGRADELRHHLLSFDWLQAKLAATDVESLAFDFDYMSGDEELSVLRGAIHLSAHVLRRDKTQLAAQLVGRLASFKYIGIKRLLRQAASKLNVGWLSELRGDLIAPGGPLLRTLAGHSARVNSIAVTPDGLRAVSGSDDWTARLWDALSGKPIGEPMRHEGPVYSAQFSPDGQWVVTASGDKMARFWDVLSGKLIGEPMRHDSDVISAQFSADGQRIVSVSAETVRLWDALSGKPIGEPMRHGARVRSVQFSADGQRVVTASGDNTARLWDALSGKPIGEPMRHGDTVAFARFSPDGQRAVTASRDKTARLWDTLSVKPIGEPMRHEDEVISAQFSPDGQRVVTASLDNTLRLWDARSGQTLRTLEGHTGEVNAVAVTPDGRRAVSASDDQTLRLWDLESGQTLCTLEGHTDSVSAVAITPDGRRAVSGSSDRTIKIWDLETQISQEQGDALISLVGLLSSPESLATELARVAITDLTRLQMLESPDLLGVREMLMTWLVRQPEGGGSSAGLAESESSQFEPDPLWLAWMVHVQGPRLQSISAELLRPSTGKPRTPTPVSRDEGSPDVRPTQAAKEVETPSTSSKSAGDREENK
jgi:WD40 repeat protein